MRIDDFCQCTPAEFAIIFEQWQLIDERTNRQSWEQTRMICWSALRPYNNKLKPSDVMAFPWEVVQEAKPESKPRQQLSNGEIQKRFEEAKRRYGLT